MIPVADGKLGWSVQLAPNTAAINFADDELVSYLIRLGAEMKQENDRARSGDGSDESEFLIFIHVHLYVNNRWYRLSVGKLDI